MKKIILNGLCLFIALLSGISLFVLKYHVKAEEEELRAIHRSILQNKREIHMLEAEWAYLNDPQRLLMLVKTQTDWQPIGSKQITTLTDIPMRSVDTTDTVEIIVPEKIPTVEPVRKAETIMQKSNEDIKSSKIKSVSAQAEKRAEKQETDSVSSSGKLDMLVKNAKSLVQQSTKEQNQKTATQRLAGTSQKDFVWSAPKKQKNESHKTSLGRIIR